MKSNILVTYASKYGSTREIAEKIGDVLRQHGQPVDVLPVDEVKDLAIYHSVILGSGIYIGKWIKEAETFLKANEASLAARLVWLFSSGPTGEGDPVKLVEGKLVPAALQPVIDNIHPRDMTVFHGHINLAKINSIEKWSIKSVVRKPFGDFRNWDQIAAWATGIADALKHAQNAA